MLDPVRAQRLAEHALRLAARAGADEAEVAVEAQDEELNRFTHEHPVQNVLRGTASVAVRVRSGGRQGKASTGTPTEEAVARTVERALAVAKLSPAADLPPLPGAQSHALRGRGPLRADPEATATAVGSVTDAARAAGCRAAGIHHGVSTLRLLMNSRGLAVHDWDTVAQVSVSAFRDDGAGWACATGDGHARLDAPAVAARAVDKAVKSRAPRAVPPGRYDVVLEPAAVSSLLLFTASHGFGAQQVLDGCSFLAGRLGEPVFGENISLSDDAFHPMTVGPVFDGEGLPRQRVALVENGVARGLVHDQVTAKRAGCASTGHSLPQPSRDGPQPGNLCLAAGAGGDTEALIRGMKRGLLITQFHYSNVVEPTKLTLTGMTRNGTFLVENGEIVGAVKNMRYTESLTEALKRVSGVGGDLRLASALFGGWVVVPSLRVEGFGFSSGTEF